MSLKQASKIWNLTDAIYDYDSCCLLMALWYFSYITKGKVRSARSWVRCTVEIAHLSSYVSNLSKCLPNYDLQSKGESKFSKMPCIWPNSTSVKPNKGLSFRSSGLQSCCLSLSSMSLGIWERRATLRWNTSFVCLLACLVVWNL